MSLLAALAKGLGAGTLQNAKAGFDEQTRQKEEIRRQAEMREQISANKDESIREWQKRDEQLNKQLTASKDELNARLTAEAAEAEKQRAHELAMFERRLADLPDNPYSVGKTEYFHPLEVQNYLGDKKTVFLSDAEAGLISLRNKLSTLSESNEDDLKYVLAKRERDLV